MASDIRWDVMPGNDEFGRIFRGLKSTCQLLVVNPSSQNLEMLYEVCCKVDPSVLSKFLQYINVPFVVNLTNKSDETACDLLKYLEKIIKLCEISDIETFTGLYVIIFLKLQDKNSPETVRNTSEELKLAVLKCASQLVRSSTSEVRRTFLSKAYYSKLSVGVFYCSQLAAFEKYVTLRVEALNCLLLLTHLSDDTPCDESFKPELAEILMLMVPGISSKCLNIINNNEVQNHQPVVLAIRLWSRLVAIVMSNFTAEQMSLSFSLQNLKLEDDQNPMESMRTSRSEDFLSAMKNLKRDRHWIMNTDKNMAAVTKLIVNCQTHHHWKVRLELATASFHLLANCGINMPQSVGYLAEALTFLSQDENSKVNESSKTYIAKLAEKCEAQSNRKLADLVVENFYSLLTRLPRILRGADVTLKEKELILMCGFMDILGHKNFPAFLCSAQHLNRFLHCLMILATPDCRSVSLMEEVTLRGIDSTLHSSEAKWRHLKFCDSPKYEAALKNLCCKLIKYSDFEMLINSLLDEFNSKSPYKRNILLLFIYLFSSGSSSDFQKYSPLLKDVIKSIMAFSLWYVPTMLTDDSTPKNVIQENIIQVCLLCELVGCLSVASGKEAFSPLLLQCLYPVLECSGSPLSIVSAAGQSSLQKLALLYEDGEVSTLIKNNVDYLSHHVMLKLRQAHRNPRVLSVLSVIMDYTSLNMLSSLHDIINDVLIQSCDRFQDINGSAFLHVFHTYLSCIKKWTTKPILPPLSKEFNQKDLESIMTELMEYNQALIDADSPPEEPSDTSIDPSQFLQGEETETKTDAEEVKEKLPDHIKLTKDILSRSLHFLPANNISRQILVLEILNQGIEILSSWTDELLPIVHKIWSPFVGRFQAGAHPLLLQRAFSLLRTLAMYSRDFIKTRTAKEVLPNLYKVLQDSSWESKKSDTTGAYKLTQLYKLQLLLLSSLGELALDLELNFKDTYTMLVSTTPYLSSKQPSELQDACIKLYKEIGKKYPDVVWSHLMSVCPIQLEFKPPLKGLQDYQVENPNDDCKEEYLETVNEIIQVL